MDSHFIEAICLAAVEILGEKDAYLILKQIGVTSFTRIDSSRFSMMVFGRVLAQRYGQQVAMGLLIRIGRASLTFLRRFFHEISELGTIEFRLKPIDKRFPDALQTLAQVASAEMGEAIELSNLEGLSYEWQIHTNDLAYTPYYYFGLLEEFCYWIDARKDCQLAYAASGQPGKIASLTVQIKDMA